MKNHTPALIYVKRGKEMMTGGDSKHISLLKDFCLFPQAFLGALDAKEGLKNVWESYQETLKVFDKTKIANFAVFRLFFEKYEIKVLWVRNAPFFFEKRRIDC